MATPIPLERGEAQLSKAKRRFGKDSKGFLPSTCWGRRIEG